MGKILEAFSPPNLKCPNCDAYMNGDDWSDGVTVEWACPVCGARWIEREEEKA